MKVVRGQEETLEETTMVAHPMSMQTVIDQRWHEVRVEVDRERLAMTALEQPPAASAVATLRLRIATAVQMLQPIRGGRLEIGISGDAQRPAVP
jgi:hypothetical protein